jgi:hypothetical protein
VIGGVKRLPPVGLMLFSVSEGAGASEVEVVVVVVVEVDGPLLSPLEHATNADDIAAKMRRQAPLRRRWFEFISAA